MWKIRGGNDDSKLCPTYFHFLLFTPTAYLAIDNLCPTIRLRRFPIGKTIVFFSSLLSILRRKSIFRNVTHKQNNVFFSQVNCLIKFLNNIVIVDLVDCSNPCSLSKRKKNYLSLRFSSFVGICLWDVVTYCMWRQWLRNHICCYTKQHVTWDTEWFLYNTVD